jgi:hypothetical protein
LSVLYFPQPAVRFRPPCNIESCTEKNVFQKFSQKAVSSTINTFAICIPRNYLLDILSTILTPRGVNSIYFIIFTNLARPASTRRS